VLAISWFDTVISIPYNASIRQWVAKLADR